MAHLGVWRWSGVVHLVDTNDELLHTQGVGKQRMLTSLAILRNTSLKLAGTSSNNQHSTVSLKWRCTTNECNKFTKLENRMDIKNKVPGVKNKFSDSGNFHLPKHKR